MPHVSVLPIAQPQTTDAKVINQQGSDNTSNKESAFSGLIEQHYLGDGSGKKAKNDANGKGDTASVGNNNNSSDSSSLLKQETTESIEDKNSAMGADIVVEANGVDEQITASKSDEQVINQDAASQLLSFMTSSDKTLLKSEKTDDSITAKKEVGKSLIDEKLFTKNSILGEQISKVLTTETVSKTNDKTQEKVSADQLLMDLAKFKDKQQSKGVSELNVDGVNVDELSADDVALKQGKVKSHDEPVVVDNKPLSKTADNYAVVESAKKTMESELAEEGQLKEAEQIKNEANNNELTLNKNTNKSESSDTNTKDKNGDGKSAHFSILTSDKLSSEKITFEDDNTDKKVNSGMAPPINTTSEKTTVLNENSQHGTRTINQSTSSFMEKNNTGEQQQSSSNPDTSTSDQELSIATNESDEIIDSVKKQTVVDATGKTNINTNPITESVLSRAITPETEGIRASQNFEAMMSNVTSEISQSQKSISALQGESIAVYKKDFANAVKDKVMVMINQKIQQVEIQLDPAELGSMNIRINLQNEQAAVSFMVQSQQAKEAVEENIDKLKNMLAESGVDVGEASIEQKDKQATDEEKNAESENARNAKQEDDIEQNIEINPDKLVKASSTGVDYYA